MQFEDIQVVWNSQHDQRLYGVDDAGLHKILRTKSQRFRRMIYWQHIQTYGSSLFMISVIAAILIANYAEVLEKVGSLRPLAGWEVLALLVAMVSWLQFSLAVFLGQKMQKSREQSNTKSLREDLDREINRTTYEIRTRRNPLMGFMPPYVGSALFILVVFGITGVSRWILLPIIAAMVIALFAESRSQRRLAEQEMTHRLRELEILREKLADQHH